MLLVVNIVLVAAGDGRFSQQLIVGDKNRAGAPVAQLVSDIKLVCIAAACKKWYRINQSAEGVSMTRMDQDQ